MRIADTLWSKLLAFISQEQPVHAGVEKMANDCFGFSCTNHCGSSCEGRCENTCIRQGADVPPGNPGGPGNTGW